MSISGYSSMSHVESDDDCVFNKIEDDEVDADVDVVELFGNVDWDGYVPCQSWVNRRCTPLPFWWFKPFELLWWISVVDELDDDEEDEEPGYNMIQPPPFVLDDEDELRDEFKLLFSVVGVGVVVDVAALLSNCWW